MKNIQLFISICDESYHDECISASVVTQHDGYPSAF